MKTVDVFLLLLLIGLSTGHEKEYQENAPTSPKCFKCHARNSDYCKGEEYQCPDGSSCMTIFERFGCNKTYDSIMRRCSLNLPCDTYMYAYANGMVFFDQSRQCCKGDLCNNGTFSMPNKTYDNDGPECPFCASFDTLEKCKPVGHMVCRSFSDQCAYLSGYLRIPDGKETTFSVQGCMSKDACKYDYSENIGYFMKNIVKQGCWLPKTENDTSKEEH